MFGKIPTCPVRKYLRKSDALGVKIGALGRLNGREFFRTRQVSQTAFDAALAQFGVLGLTELTNLMGCCAMLAFNVNACGVEPPSDRTETPLPV